MRPYVLAPSSYWHAPHPPVQTYSSLSTSISTEVLIIGAGITGLTTALLLKKQGVRVVVLEAGIVGAGTTGGTSGHLEALPDQGLTRLVKSIGENSARLLTAARSSAITQIEQWTHEFGIDCDFVRIPAFSFSESPENAESLRGELQLAHAVGLSARIVEHAPVPFPNCGGLRVDQQARFHSLEYLRGLARAVHGEGCAIYEHTPALPPRDGSPGSVTTAHGAVVEADRVIVATHAPFLGVSVLDTRIAAYQSYVIAVQIDDEIPDALYWDDAEPYHYIRIASSSDRRTLLVGGADHKTGQAEDTREPFRALEEYTRQRFPVRGIIHRWSAEFFEPTDGLPFVGKAPFADSIFVATGFLGTGLTYGPAAGLLLADLLTGRESPLAEILSPSRIKPIAEASSFISENLNVAKHFVVDRFTADSIVSAAEVPPGEGRIVEHEGRKYALFVDMNSNAHFLSPVCTHAGCYVRWNSAESTWDCPCHGGRYTAEGARLYGPPPEGLKEIRVEQVNEVEHRDETDRKQRGAEKSAEL